MKGRYKRQAQIPTSKTSVEERTYFEHRELSQSEATQISLEGMMLKLKLQYFGVSPHVKSWLIGKDSDAGRDWGQEEKGAIENEMAGWHHWLDGRESEWTPGVGDGQGCLACCASWGRKESDTTERLNWTELRLLFLRREQGALSKFLPSRPRDCAQSLPSHWSQHRRCTLFAPALDILVTQQTSLH